MHHDLSNIVKYSMHLSACMKPDAFNPAYGVILDDGWMCGPEL
jgi:hypothetical protein